MARGGACNKGGGANRGKQEGKRGGCGGDLSNSFGISTSSLILSEREPFWAGRWRPRAPMRSVRASSSFLSPPSKILRFSLGDAAWGRLLSLSST